MLRPSAIAPTLATALLAAALLTAAPAGAQTCDRLPRDCDAEAAAFEARARRLQNLSDPVKAAVDALKLRRRATCLEWNACAVEDASLQRLTNWADAELQSLARADGAEARAAWARGLTQRGAAIQAQAVPQQAAPFRPQLTPQVLETIMRLKDDVEALEGFRPLVIRIQRSSVVRNRQKPRICESETRRELRTLVRSGASAVQSDAGTLAGYIDDLCEPFEKWEHPDENVQLALVRFNARLERIDGWLNEIIRCVQPGPYDFRCRNTYGEKKPDTLAQARRALGELGRVQAVMRRSGDRFPCFDPVWQRVARTEWTLRTAEANIPTLAREAERVCSRFGLEDSRLERAQERVRDTTENLVARIAQFLESRRQGLQQLRQVYGDQLPPELR